MENGNYKILTFCLALLLIVSSFFVPVHQAHASVLGSIKTFFSELFGGANNSEPVETIQPIKRYTDFDYIGPQDTSTPSSPISLSPQPLTKYISVNSTVSLAQVNARLTALESRLSQPVLSSSELVTKEFLAGQINALARSTGTSLYNVSQTISTISSSSGSGSGSSAWGAITGTLSSQTDLQSALDAKLSLSTYYATTSPISRGGTGLTSAPTYGQVLLGQADGTYSLVATSTLGISGGSSQWTTSGSNIYYSTGNVGIGTTSPSAKLSVTGSGTGTGRGFAVANSANTENFTILDNGNVGIGSSTPSHKLDISGELGIIDTIYNLNNNSRLSLASSRVQLIPGGVIALTAVGSGNIGIGTTTPGSLLSLGTTNGINFSLATSTFNSTGGINIAAGCYAVAGTCLSANGSGTTGQLPYYAANGTTLTATSSLFLASSGNFGVGNSNPNAALSVTSLAAATYTNQVPTMSSNTAPSGVASASADAGGSYPAWKAFDKTNATQANSWVAVATTGWLKYQFPAAKIISRYSITNRNDGAVPRAIKSWTFEGSNDDSNWTVLDTQTNITDWAVTSNVKKTFLVSSPSSFLYYRVNISASNDAGYIGIGELELDSATIGSSKIAEFGSLASTVMTILTGGNVGIGTTTPSATFSVTGAGASTGRSLAISDVNNIETFTVLDNGNIGIGTTSPYAKLSVAGTVVGQNFVATSTTATSTFQGTVLAASAGSVGVGTTTPAGKFAVNGSTFLSNSSDITLLSLYAPSISNSTALNITGPVSTSISDGKAFGFTATGEGYARGLFYTDGSYGLGSGAATRDTYISRSGLSTILISSDRSTGLADLVVTGNIGAGTTTPSAKLSVTGTGTGTGRGFVFANSANAEKFTILNNGNVGIGTTSPVNLLSIENSTDVAAFKVYSSGIVNESAFEIAGPTSSNLSTGKGFQIKTLGEAFGRAIFYSDGKYAIGPGTGTRDTVLSRSAANTFRISSDGSTGSANLIVNGNVGIGTTTPQGKLAVVGGTAIFDSPGSQIRLPATSGAQSVNDLGIFNGSSGSTVFRLADWGTGLNGLFINTATGNIGIGTTSPAFPLDVYSSVASNQSYGYLSSNGTIGTSNGVNNYSIRAQQRVLAQEFNAVSDARLKDVQFNLDSDLALSLIARLQPVSFTWKNNPTGQPVLGFLAQDVESVIPNAVSKLSTENFPDQRELSYNQLVAVAIGAIKELNLKVENIGGYASSTIPTDAESESLFAELLTGPAHWMSNRFTAAVGFFRNIYAEKIKTKEIATDKLCVGTTCVTEDQLKNLLQNNGVASVAAPVVIPPPEVPVVEATSTQSIATSTPPIVEETIATSTEPIVEEIIPTPTPIPIETASSSPEQQ